MTRVCLTEITESLESGSRPKGGVRQVAEGMLSLGGEHLDDQGGFDLSTPKFIPPDFFSSMNRGHIQKGDILIVKDGATTGKTSLVRSSFPYDKAAINEHVFQLRIDTKRADPVYVFHYLFSDLGQRQILSDFRGATVGGIGRTFLDCVEVPLPPLPEQKRIAAILDKADAIRKKRKKAIGLTETFLRSAFLEMFGDPVTNPKGWPVEPLESLIDRERGISYGIVQRGTEVDDGVPVIRISNFTANRFDGSEIVRTAQGISQKFRRTVIRGGELLLSIRGTVGRVAVAPTSAQGWNVSREVAVIPLLPNVSRDFVHCSMLMDGSQRFMAGEVKGVAQSGINLSDVRRLPIPRPPAGAEERFLHVVSAIERQRRRVESSAHHVRSLFDSLAHRAFRGEL